MEVTMSQAAPQAHSPQSIADIALAFLSENQQNLQAAFADDPRVQSHEPDASKQVTLEHARLPPVVRAFDARTLAPIQTGAPTRNTGAGATANNSIASATPHRLPSLLRYVDVELMQSAAHHDQPTHPGACCVICFYKSDTPINALEANLGQPAVTSTFLPLSPCNHWVHYRCLIWLASTSDIKSRNKCPQCQTTLFKWDGITALTLATRTGIDMEDSSTGGSLVPGSFAVSDKTRYEADCAIIESLIHAQFFQHLNKVSKFADGSPDLVQCFYDVLDALKRMGKPQARWLEYETQTGYLLWGMLVIIKMRRFLVEGHAAIRGTEAWRAFEEGMGTVQGRILAEIKKG
jgi:hypothetical protein